MSVFGRLEQGECGKAGSNTKRYHCLGNCWTLADVVLGPVVSHANNQNNDVNLVFEHGHNGSGTVWRVHVLFANVTILNDQFDMRVRLKREVW